jgi:hypothetical protein
LNGLIGGVVDLAIAPTTALRSVEAIRAGTKRRPIEPACFIRPEVRRGAKSPIGSNGNFA